MLDDLDAQKLAFYTFWKLLETKNKSEKNCIFYCTFCIWKIKYWVKNNLNKQAQQIKNKTDTSVFC